MSIGFPDISIALESSARAAPLCRFTWPTTFCVAVVRSCFHFVTIPLTADRGIFSSKEISWMDLLHRWQPITVPRLNSLIS
ncbi:unnamed protein product [Staurois parvus]|uniref:Uncharacterized protein n=1 Tax=Staurois parvus TaxID=386267 RepID=A0ABN9BFP1_9NEOB|nr:unnamed protein product [Staurois parvus]